MATFGTTSLIKHGFDDTRYYDDKFTNTSYNRQNGSFTSQLGESQLKFTGLLSYDANLGHSVGKINAVDFQSGNGAIATVTGLNIGGAAMALLMEKGDGEAFFKTIFSGSDKIIGSKWKDGLHGYAGDDTLAGGALSDTLYGDSGNDRLVGENDRDVLYGGTGIDALFGGEGVDNLFGGEGNDWLYGGTHGDFLWGQTGHDKLVGGGGDDALSGGRGDDTLIGDTQDDYLRGDEGDDSVFGGLGADTLIGGAGNDAINAGGLDDEVDVFIFANGHGKDQVGGFDSEMDILALGSVYWNGVTTAAQLVQKYAETVTVEKDVSGVKVKEVVGVKIEAGGQKIFIHDVDSAADLISQIRHVEDFI